MESKQKSIIVKYSKIFFAAMFAIYLIYLSYLTFFSHIYGRTYSHRNINIIPFKTILNYLTFSFNTDIILRNIFGNIIAFVPMGFLLPSIFKKFAALRSAIFIILFATITIEVIQYIAAVGTSDIDDIFLNLIGGILGYSLSKLFIKILKYIRWRRKDGENKRKENIFLKFCK